MTAVPPAGDAERLSGERLARLLERHAELEERRREAQARLGVLAAGAGSDASLLIAPAVTAARSAVARAERELGAVEAQIIDLDDAARAAGLDAQPWDDTAGRPRERLRPSERHVWRAGLLRSPRPRE